MSSATVPVLTYCPDDPIAMNTAQASGAIARLGIANSLPLNKNGALDVGVEGAVGPETDGGYQLAGFGCGKGETGIPGPIFCRLPVIT